MTWVAAGAVVVGAVVGSQATKSAAKTAADAQASASAIIAAAAEQGREDVLKFSAIAGEDLLRGSSAAFDIFGTGLQQQQQALTGGNLQAQQTLQGGFANVQQALLGTGQPSFAAPVAPAGQTGQAIQPIANPLAPVMGPQPAIPTGGGTPIAGGVNVLPPTPVNTGPIQNPFTQQILAIDQANAAAAQAAAQQASPSNLQQTLAGLNFGLGQF